MTYPSTHQPLFQRIGELFISGSGVSPSNDPTVSGSYFIPTGSFETRWWFEDMPEEAIALNAMVKPQMLYRIVSKRGTNAWLGINRERMFDVTFAFELAYYTNATELQGVRRALELKINDDVNTIIKTLCFPGNVATTNEGEPTGVISGMFLDETVTVAESRFDKELSMVFVTITIDCKLVLGNGLPGSGPGS